MEGTPRSDSISGAADNDYIDGQGDPDKLVGGRGNDTIWGGPGGDTLYGLAGNDVLIGEYGHDRLVGGDDRIGDAIWGQPICCTFLASGGGGNDTINILKHPFDVYEGISTPDTAECGTGSDDRVKANPDDTVAEDCEHVRIVVQ